VWGVFLLTRQIEGSQSGCVCAGARAGVRYLQSFVGGRVFFTMKPMAGRITIKVQWQAASGCLAASVDCSYALRSSLLQHAVTRSDV